MGYTRDILGYTSKGIYWDIMGYTRDILGIYWNILGYIGIY